MPGPPPRPLYTASTVAHGASPAQLAGLMVGLGAAAVVLSPTLGMAGVGAIGLMIVLTALGMVTRRRGRLEWDGEQLHWREGRKRHLIAVRGDGWVVRVAFAPTNLAAHGKPTQYLVWVDHTGRARAPIMPERLWDPVQLDRLRRAAGLAIVDDASPSFKDVGKRYPGSVPTYLTNHTLTIVLALPIAVTLVVLSLHG